MSRFGILEGGRVTFFPNVPSYGRKNYGPVEWQYGIGLRVWVTMPRFDKISNSCMLTVVEIYGPLGCKPSGSSVCVGDGASHLSSYTDYKKYYVC